MSLQTVCGAFAALSGFLPDGKRLAIAVILLFCASCSAAVQTSDFTILYTFPSGSVAVPDSLPVIDSHGNVYGTTSLGGSAGAGTVYKVDTTGTESTLYSFTGLNDGGGPGPLIRGQNGNMYGFTTWGGDYQACFGVGCGTVFEIDADGTQTTLFPLELFAPTSFIRDASGTFYGTDNADPNAICFDSCGEVFSISPRGVETVLYRFSESTIDAYEPLYNLTRDSAGNLSGVSRFGGLGGYGTVFRIDRLRQETLLFSFEGPENVSPAGPLLEDNEGNLFGATNGLGQIFEISPAGVITVRYSFPEGGADGQEPGGRMVRDLAGNFYGTTMSGGSEGRGVIFKVDPSGVQTVLHNFVGEPKGGYPSGGLTMGRTSTGSGYALYGFNNISNGLIFRLLLPPNAEPDVQP